MRFYPLLFSAALVSVTSTLASADPGDGNYYFFGDSGLSMGNLYITYPSIPTDPRYSTDGLIHRESNGWVWPEYMLGGDVRTALDPTGTSRNVNFAFSGANSGPLGLGMLPGGGVDYFAPTGVHSQFAMFEDYLATAGTTVGADDIFFVGAGANDYFNKMPFVPLDQITADLVDNTVASIEYLASKGANFIFVEPVPDFDIAPEFANFPEDDRAFLRDLTTNARAMQASEVASLLPGLPNDVTVVSLRIDGAVYYMTDKAAELGFTSTSGRCISAEGELCSESLAEQNKYIFWDHLHLTTKAQQIQAQYYQAFVDAGIGLSGRYAARLPDLALQALKGGADSVSNRATYSYGDGLSLFMETRLTSGKLEGDNDLDSEFDFQRYGGGLELRLTDTNRMGVSYHYLTGDFDAEADSPMGGADMKAHIASFYGNFSNGSAFLDTSFQYAWMDFEDFWRDTGAPALTGRGETSGKTWAFEAQGGVTLTMGSLALKPYLMARHAKATVDAFAEDADGLHGLALSYSEQKATSTRAGVGLRAQLATETEGFGISPWINVRYDRELKDKPRDVSYEIIDNWARPITYGTNKAEQDLLHVDAGVSVAITDSLRLNISYGAEFLSKERLTRNAYAGLSFRF